MSMYPTKNFLVTAKHPSPRYCFTNTPVRAAYDVGFGSWYATGILGCSKNYATARDAVLSLFEDHFCRDIQIEEITSRAVAQAEIAYGEGIVAAMKLLERCEAREGRQLTITEFRAVLIESTILKPDALNELARVVFELFKR
jgi:hypothetical protein